MIYVTIAGDTRRLSDVNMNWIHEQIDGRRNDRQTVCVRVEIDEPPIKMGLSTPGCPPSSGGRPFRPEESSIHEVWDQLRLNDERFTAGNLNAFLRRLPYMV